MTELDEIAENLHKQFPGFWPMTYAQANALARLTLIHEDSQVMIDNLTDSLLAMYI